MAPSSAPCPAGRRSAGRCRRWRKIAPPTLHTATASPSPISKWVAEPGGSSFSAPTFTNAMLSFLYHGGRDDPPWETVYVSQSDAELSWGAGRNCGQARSQRRQPGGSKSACWGTSPLAEGCATGLGMLTSQRRSIARATPGHLASDWLVADVTAGPDLGRFDIGMTAPSSTFSRAKIARLTRAPARTVPAGGHAVIATFALDGPKNAAGWSPAL